MRKYVNKNEQNQMKERKIDDTIVYFAYLCGFFFFQNKMMIDEN